MTSFEDREKSFEKKFILDEQTKFKIEARRNKLIGEWVSSILGFDDHQKELYIQEVIVSDFKKAGDEDVFEKVKYDLEGKNISDEEIRKKMNEFFDLAASSLKSK